MRFLVLGGTGFLGSHLVESLLNDGHEVICVDSGVIGRAENIQHLIGKKNLVVQTHDITSWFDFGPVDWICHLASPTAPAETYKHPDMTLRVNSEATLRMLKMADKYDAKLLFASSIKVKDRITFGSTYIQGKILGEQFCAESPRSVVARMGNIYGPRMALNDSRVIPSFIRSCYYGHPITVWGDGSQIDSFCYVDDAVRALRMIMGNPCRPLFEIGNPEGISILELAYEILGTLRIEVPIIFDQPGGSQVVICNNAACANNRTARALAAKQRKVPDISLIETELGWYPSVSMADGIKRTYEFYSRELKKK